MVRSAVHVWPTALLVTLACHQECQASFFLLFCSACYWTWSIPASRNRSPVKINNKSTHFVGNSNLEQVERSSVQVIIKYIVKRFNWKDQKKKRSSLIQDTPKWYFVHEFVSVTIQKSLNLSDKNWQFTIVLFQHLFDLEIRSRSPDC